MRSNISRQQAMASNWPVLSSNQPRQAGVALDRSVCVVGARANVHLPLESRYVSKAHALLVQCADGTYVRDLASRNHTFVNKSPVRELQLAPADLLRIGEFSYICSDGFGGTLAPAVPAEPAALWELDGANEPFPIQGRTVLLGSRRECDIVIASDAVASAHAVVFEQDGRRFVRDLDTPAGTFLNGKPVRQSELRSGDVIRVAASEWEYDFVDADIKGAEPSEQVVDPLAETVITRVAPATPAPREVSGNANTPWTFDDETEAESNKPVPDRSRDFRSPRDNASKIRR